MTMNEADQLLLNLLNLKSSEIESIKVSVTDGITVYTVTLKYPDDRTCLCGFPSMISKGYYTKEIKLFHMAFQKSKVLLRIPRLWCPVCRTSASEPRYLAPRNQSVSYQIVQQVMDLLKNPRMTFKECASIVGISATTVVRIFDKHCHITRNTFPEAVCIDEVYCPLTDMDDSKYICMFYDFYRHTVVDVLPSRQKRYLDHYLEPLQHSGELANVKFIVMDCHDAYRRIAHRYMKAAAVCADSFHLIKQLNDSFSKLRVRIMKKYDSNSVEYYLLKRWKNLLMDRHMDMNNKGKYNKKLGEIINYEGLRNRMLEIDNELGNAWYLKEKYCIFNETAKYENAAEQLQAITEEFVNTDIPEYRAFTNTIINWRKEIVNSFQLYNGRRLNNGVAESLNNTVATLIYNTHGMRNSERRRKRIMYALNKKGFSIK